MKNLSTYINEKSRPKYVGPGFGWDFDSWCVRNGITEPTNEDIDWFMDHSWAHKHETGQHRQLWEPQSISDTNPLDRLTEMLRAVNLRALANSVQRELGRKYKQQVITYPDNAAELIDSVEVRIPTALYKNDKDFDVFCRTLETMAWYFSHIVRSKSDTKMCTVVIEPINANDVTDYIMKECGGIVYHVTDRKNLIYILKTGLRTKGKDTPIDLSPMSNHNAPTYRSFPNRTHFICAETEDKAAQLIIDIACDKQLLMSELAILRIDLNKHKCNVRFYTDGLYIGKNFVYTMAYFPPKFIDVIEI